MSDFVVENDNSLKLNVVICIAGGGGCNIYDGRYNPPPLSDIIKQKMFGDQFFLREIFLHEYIAFLEFFANIIDNKMHLKHK